MSYDSVLKKKKMDFDTFKLLYGFNDNAPRNIKLGNDHLIVDNKTFTVKNINMA